MRQLKPAGFHGRHARRSTVSANSVFVLSIVLREGRRKRELLSGVERANSLQVLVNFQL